MRKYTVDKQTFIILDPTERNYLTQTLEACETFVRTVGTPTDWNGHDQGIFIGMLYLNGTLGYISPLVPDDYPSLGIDPTTDQYKKFNMAVGKIMKDFGPQPGIAKLTHTGAKGTLTDGDMTKRMNDRRTALWNWIQNNIAELKEIQEVKPKLIDNICHKPSCSADHKLYQNIRTLLQPPTNHSDLGELFA